MSLVAYSDSEGSDDEKTSQPKAPLSKPATASSNTSFTVNKTNPRKIQVKLHDLPANDDTNGEPAAKRPRIGASAFSGFNSMLPAPKRDADAKNVPKPAARKVFSLKTGAEPGFSREADAEMRQLFAEQETGMDGRFESGTQDQDETIPSIPKNSVNDETSTSKAATPKGNPFMFKPLSVARNNKKPKRKADGPILPKIAADGAGTASLTSDKPHSSEVVAPAPVPPKKVSLFGTGIDNAIPEGSPQVVPDEEDEIVEILDDPVGEEDLSSTPVNQPSTVPSIAHHGQSLDAIASDLGLSKADRRQLFGRRGNNTRGTAINVVNFNTDQEYAANEELRAAGEQVQHNPVRAIAPGKHNLKQLLNAATTQKDALEESFASGRRNKREAGNKYGW
ncbi:hypothetical protein H2204_003682 [Knufia peltigerae]|uniref:Mitotic checkpoint regulator, MAD2B-interacting-domain-containing protein n=1 Tax=Knufia peltigerae TaxID=1002370 RepID=A0AA38Y933_9EURO|nr:hypothetical protein H2204_003682 [Knufia peltigerae]